MAQIKYMQVKQTSNIYTHAKAIGVTTILYNDIICTCIAVNGWTIVDVGAN